MIGIIIIVTLWISIYLLMKSKTAENKTDKSTTLKKFLFFWVIFHSIGYISFLAGITPSFKRDRENMQKEIYLITPEYNTYTRENEEDHFYPFHSFTESSYLGNTVKVKFVGLWGYYGHYEYLVYVIIPFVIFLLYKFYNRFIKS